MPSLCGLLFALLIDAVCVVVCVAGIGKALDADAFRISLATWRLLPVWSTAPIAVLVPTLEIFAAGCCLAGVKRRLAGCLVAVLLLAFTILYVAHLFTMTPPHCNCAGVLERFVAVRHTGVAVVLRNTALIAALLSGLLGHHLLTRPERPQPAQRADADSSPRPASSAFTLIEMLLVIAIVGIALALIVPSLAGARLQGRDAVSLSNLRGHSGVFAIYSNDHGDHFPYFTDPTMDRTELTARGVTIDPPYFLAYNSWNFALADDYYDGDPVQRSFFPPDFDRSVAVPSNRTLYWYACSFLADSHFWRQDFRVSGRSQWRATRQHEVLHPSRKVLLYCGVGSTGVPTFVDYSARLAPMAFCDGRAEFYLGSAIRSGYPHGDGDEHPTFHHSPNPPGMHTIGGVAGDDVLE